MHQFKVIKENQYFYKRKQGDFFRSILIFATMLFFFVCVGWGGGREGGTWKACGMADIPDNFFWYS